MIQKTNALRLVSQIISNDDRGFKMASKQKLGNLHEIKTKEKF